ncbi:Shugoshin-like 1 [Liparis tanakae]|uniref:Shugoshin-like 1 n=1 Tax=Liparis tanakae TaxID=230148 RepID=A0A4Z2J8C0_9TELE|nr:Shugoshin-like 1 [Liparis tanakae]
MCGSFRSANVEAKSYRSEAMARERPQKKSFQQSLEDIKERMKEKRNTRMARALAPRRARSKLINNSSVVNSIHTILKGVQLNNKELAVALQAEKEKGRQANAVILQLKREQQALFLHLLLLRKKLKEQEALAASATQTKAPNVLVEPKHCEDSTRRKPSSQNLDKPIVCKSSPICADHTSSEKIVHSDQQVVLPSTVGVRRQHADRRSRRRSERVQLKKSLSEGDPIIDVGTLIASPIYSDHENTNQPQREEKMDFADPVGTEDFLHSTPEPVPPQKNNNQQRPSRKKAQQQPRPKPEPAPQKVERGRKPDRAPLKKPWENPKPKARSKSRDRSATRAQTAKLSQGNKLNSSLGFNDTFDFDCEGAVHVTPFRAKAEDNQSTRLSEETPQPEATPLLSKQIESSSSSTASESEDSLYVPQKSRRPHTSPDRTKGITTRRGRHSKVVREKEIIPPKQEICEPPRGANEKDCFLPVSPLVEVEMMRIDTVLSNFGNSSGEAPHLPHQTPQRIKKCKKRGLGVRTAGRGLSLCDVTNVSPAAYRKLSPVPPRKRRCTMVVDYKEPTLNAKLRRGDKFTDLQFLRSPIFKKNSGRRSVQKSRNSISSQQPFDKYNESFVGCR